MAKIILVSRCAWTLYNYRLEQMRALVRRGDTVIGGGGAGDGFEPRIEALGVPFTPLPVHKRALNPPADIQLFRTLYRWYRRERPDIVHHFTIKPVIYGSLAARLARVPRVINSIDGLGVSFGGERITPLRRVVEMQYRKALHAADFTFFANDEDRGLFVKRGIVPAAKAGLLPGTGVDTEHFAPQPGPERGVGKGRFLMVARLLRDKGIYEFVEAARLVRREHPEAEFALLGGRDERNPTAVTQEELDHWLSEGLVEHLGQTDDVRPYVAESDVVVLPSYYREGLPCCLLEAASMGKALITTDNVGCRHAVDDGRNGILVPVRDVKALAGAMRTLLCDPELRRRMGQAGRDRAVNEFDVRIAIERIFAAYEGKRLT